MNEETIIENRPTANGQSENKQEGSAWKHVTLGGVTGILMGAGLMYASQASAAPKEENVDTEASENENDAAPAESQPVEALLHVAQMHNDLSFGEAFAAARAEVGPGGVFIWHGGIYNTYTADEWNVMTPEQKSDFAHQVNPEVSAHAVPTPTDAHPDVSAVSAHPVATEAPAQSDDVTIVDEISAQDAPDDGDVHIVGYTNVEGHLAVGYDTTGDGQADVAIIDVDDSGDLSASDIVVDDQGNMATVGEIVDSHADSYDQTTMEQPDMDASYSDDSLQLIDA